MNTEHHEADSNHNPNDSTAGRTNGSDGSRWNDLVRRARAAATDLPSQVDEQIKRKPYMALGIACVIGAGVGIALSSRILRAILTATATAAALELTRALIRENLFRAKA
jgi:broad specificity phosphatase PhoE